MLHTFGIYVLDIHKVMMSIFKSLFFSTLPNDHKFGSNSRLALFPGLYGFWLHEERPQGLVFEVT